MNLRTAFVAVCLLALAASESPAAGPYADRFVWIYGWSLGQDRDVTEITRLLENAASHGINGAIVSFNLDTLSKQSPAYLRRLDAVNAACASNHIELIPAIFSVGYGSVLAYDPNLAEGLIVKDAPFIASAGEAKLAASNSPSLANGGFENFSATGPDGFTFSDQPGKSTAMDFAIHHDGKASLKFEVLGGKTPGHGRVFQEISVTPNRCYRVSAWVKTEGLRPASAFRLEVTDPNNKELNQRHFNLPLTNDWRKVSLVFNSLNFDRVRLTAGFWAAAAGQAWLDDWAVEELGPVNPLHRPGTPTTVRSADGSVTYQEGRDYTALQDPHLNPSRDDGPAMPLKLLPGGRIQDGDRLRVSWYHSILINRFQVSVCMAEPELYEIFDRQAAAVAARLHPSRVLLSMDEIRGGGTCEACRGRDLGELLGDCVTRQMQIVRRHLPGAEIYVWADMFDPALNARGNYFMAEGSFAGSWKHVPKDVIMAAWGAAPQPKNLRFFADQGFRTLACCYYDANDLKEVKSWLDAARPLTNVTGFMYTPWQKKYDLLPDFADLLKNESAPAK